MEQKFFFSSHKIYITAQMTWVNLTKLDQSRFTEWFWKKSIYWTKQVNLTPYKNYYPNRNFGESDESCDIISCEIIIYWKHELIRMSTVLIQTMVLMMIIVFFELNQTPKPHTDQADNSLLFSQHRLNPYLIEKNWPECCNKLWNCCPAFFIYFITKMAIYLK